MRNSIVMLIFVLMLILQGCSPKNPPAPSHTVAAPMYLKLLIIDYDPELPTRDNVKMGDYMGSEPVEENIYDLVDRLHSASHGILNYTVEYMYVNEFPRHNDGFQVDRVQFPDLWDEAEWDLFRTIEEKGSYFDYTYFIEQFNLIKRRNRGEIDEVWFISEFANGSETVMVGRGAYEINGSLIKADCKPFRINQIARHRFDTPLENLGHSAEAIMSNVSCVMTKP